MNQDEYRARSASNSQSFLLASCKYQKETSDFGFRLWSKVERSRGCEARRQALTQVLEKVEAKVDPFEGRSVQQVCGHLKVEFEGRAGRKAGLLVS